MKFLRKIIQIPFDRIPSDDQISILTGKLRGTKWVIGSGIPEQWIGFCKDEILATPEYIPTGN